MKPIKRRKPKPIRMPNNQAVAQEIKQKITPAPKIAIFGIQSDVNILQGSLSFPEPNVYVGFKNVNNAGKTPEQAKEESGKRTFEEMDLALVFLNTDAVDFVIQQLLKAKQKLAQLQFQAHPIIIPGRNGG